MSQFELDLRPLGGDICLAVNIIPPPSRLESPPSRLDFEFDLYQVEIFLYYLGGTHKARYVLGMILNSLSVKLTTLLSP